MLIGWFYKFIIVLALLTTVGTHGSVPAVFSIKALSQRQEACSKWTRNMAQMSEPPTTTRKCRHSLHLDTVRHERVDRKQAELKRRVSGVSSRPGSNGNNERATLKYREFRTQKRGPFTRTIQSLARSGSYSLPLLTDAVWFSLWQPLSPFSNCAV